MTLEHQLKIALDESRLLILGSQVLFGFQFHGIFQQQFDSLTTGARLLLCAGLPLLTVALAVLITPSMNHRIVERGRDSRRILGLATICTGVALFPVALALALDMFVAMERAATWAVAAGVASVFFGLAMLCWYVVAWINKRQEDEMAEEPARGTSLDTQVEQLLTEARIIIPGVQTLLGFQLTVTLTQAFAQLPADAKAAHAAALCCMGLAVILLMAPASLHRIAFSGQAEPEFLHIGSFFVMTAPFPLAVGISLDAYVAGGRALQSEAAAMVLAVASLVLLLAVWYAYPWWRRMNA